MGDELKTTQAGERFDPSAIRATWNKIVENLRRSSVREPVPTGPQQGPAPLWAVVTATHPDYLVCKLPDTDGVPYGDWFRVAKPFELRHDAAWYSGIDGLSTEDANTVSVTGDEYDEETWKVTPAYVAEKTIILVGHCDVPLTVSGVSDPIMLIDLNIGARAWAKS